MQSDVSDLLWTQGHSQICNNMSVHHFLAKVPCQSDKVTYNITVNTLIWSHSQMSPFSILHSQILFIHMLILSFWLALADTFVSLFEIQ